MFDRPSQSLILSVAIHSGLVISLLFVRFAVAPVREPRFNAMPLMTPGVAPKRVSVRTQRKTAAFRAPPFRLPSTALAPALAVEAPPALQPAALTVPAAAPQIRGGEFSVATASPAPVAKKTEISTAGFGDSAVAPGGPIRGVISSVGGFGDANALEAPAGSNRIIRAGGFGDTIAAAPTGGRRLAETQTITAAQILAKPRPVYTEEARRLQIEGEVQLEIMFRASGQIDILRVVRGLGHGLDESAVQAARTIRFTPARRDGQAVDSTATVHIIFQLAS